MGIVIEHPHFRRKGAFRIGIFGRLGNRGKGSWIFLGSRREVFNIVYFLSDFHRKQYQV
jgi:hypothetical protein